MTREEREVYEYETAPKFKAYPVNRSILDKPASLPAPAERRPLTVPQSFNLETDSRSRAKESLTQRDGSSSLSSTLSSNGRPDSRSATIGQAPNSTFGHSQYVFHVGNHEIKKQSHPKPHRPLTLTQARSPKLHTRTVRLLMRISMKL